MKKFAIALFCLVLGAGSSLHAQTIDPLGIWRAMLEGKPGTILTLADDSGEIGGTLVMYGLNPETGNVAVMEAHTLVHPRMDGHTLTFQVRRPDTNMMTFRVEFKTADKAEIHCTSCGEDAPVAELTKETL
jgi:hypothetical protein